MADSKIANTKGVVLDILFEKGLLFFVLKNYDDTGARQVRFLFNAKIKGVNGTKEITDLNIFKHLDYLAPGKEIKIFIDTAVSYFARKEASILKVRIDWTNEAKEKFTRVIEHNLEIYQDLGYLNNID